MRIKYTYNVYFSNTLTELKVEIIKPYHQGSKKGDVLYKLKSKLPEWRDGMHDGDYVLDFNHGIATVPSAKNIILAGKRSDSLQFGKVGKNDYVGEIGFPFSIMQGIIVCLSTFRSKL